MISDTRSWRNWQTHYLEVVAGQPMEVQILSSAAKQARESHTPEAKYDWAGGWVLGGPNPLEPRQGRGKRSEASERVPSAGGEIGLARGQVSRGANPLEVFLS